VYPRLRIVQIAPLYESVPPKLYGGTERIVSYLSEELIRQKHEVTLFASGDSETRARLVPITERAVRLDGSRIKDPLPHHLRLVERALRGALAEALMFAEATETKAEVKTRCRRLLDRLNRLFWCDCC
jgi:glycosyltransferase involved in cell wall biosynthesis